MTRRSYTTTRKPGLLSRLRGRGNTTTTTTTTTTTRKTRRGNRAHAGVHAGPVGVSTTAGAPVHHHHRRRPSMGDKVSGAMMKLRGSLTRRPGLKAAGTRRMHGTDGRGAHHVAYWLFHFCEGLVGRNPASDPHLYWIFLHWFHFAFLILFMHDEDNGLGNCTIMISLWSLWGRAALSVIMNATCVWYEDLWKN